MTFLEGRVTKLRPMELADLDGPYACWINNQAADHFSQHALFPQNIDDLRRFYDGLRANRNVLHLAIEDAGSGQHVGNISLQNIDWINRRAEFAILLGHPEAAGKGLATEASSLLLNHGFRRLNLKRVWLGVNAENQKALNLYKRLHFREEGRMREHIYSQGRYVDIVMMGLLREDFQ